LFNTTTEEQYILQTEYISFSFWISSRVYAFAFYFC